MENNKIWKFLKYYVKPYYKKLIIVLILFLVFIPLSIIHPWISKIIIDDGLMTGDFNFMVKITGLLLLLKLFESALGFFVQYQFNILNINFVKDIRNNLFQNTLKFNVNSFLKFGKGNILSRLISDVQLISGTFSVILFSLLYQIITIVILSFILINLNYKLAAAVYLFIPVYVLLIKKLNPKIIKLTGEERKKFDKISEALQESFNGVKEIKSLGIASNISKLFNSHLNNHLETNRKKIIITYLASNISNLISGFPYIIILFFGSMLVFDKILTIGELLAYLQYAMMIFNPIKQLVEQNFNYQAAIPSIERLSELKDESYFDYYENNELEADKTKYISNSAIKFKDVSFSYNPPSLLLNNINMEIKKGEPAAIVGKSGVGKSTIVQLLLRWIKPTDGRVLIGDKDIYEYNNETLKKEISVVLQESFWFNTSIRNNFKVINNKITTEEIVELLKKVNILDFILAKENGIDFVVGENGNNLSLGEKQRLSIARALIFDPKILIFDEITSSVDGISEKFIIDLIEDLKSEKIILLITHRASSISKFNRVIYIEDGKISAVGNHQDLIVNNPNYKKNFNVIEKTEVV